MISFFDNMKFVYSLKNYWKVTVTYGLGESYQVIIFFIAIVVQINFVGVNSRKVLLKNFFF